MPKFRSDMTAPEIAAMLESLYRVRGGAVDSRPLRCSRAVPRHHGFQFDFEHLDSRRAVARGRAVGAVDRREVLSNLYDAARSHYYANALPDFEVMANNARIRT